MDEQQSRRDRERCQRLKKFDKKIKATKNKSRTVTKGLRNKNNVTVEYEPEQVQKV